MNIVDSNNASFIEHVARNKYKLDEAWLCDHVHLGEKSIHAHRVCFSMLSGERYEAIVTPADIERVLLHPGDDVMIDNFTPGKIIEIRFEPIPGAIVEYTTRAFLTPERLRKL